MLRFLAVAVFTIGSISLAPVVARADVVPQVAFDDDVDSAPVLMHRYRPFRFNVEVSLLFTPTVVEKYLNHLGGMAAVGLHLNNVFALELLGGYVRTNETGIVGGAEGVRANLAGLREPNLPDLVGMSWIVQAGATIAPIYGKLNLLSEVDFPSQVYLIGGIGVVGAVRKVLTGADFVSTANANAGVKLAGSFGIGFKLFLLRWMALRVEFRDFLYSDSYKFGSEPSSPAEIDFVHNFMGLFGLSFVVN